MIILCTVRKTASSVKNSHLYFNVLAQKSQINDAKSMQHKLYAEYAANL